MEIRDTRNGDWHWVNNAVIACKHITHAEKSVYCALATFGNCKEIHPSFETIAERANVSLRHAKRAIQRLVEVGYLSAKKGGGRGHSNVYYLLKASKGCQECTVSKRCQKKQERVTNDAIKGDRVSPQEDKEADKEIKKRDLKKLKKYQSLKSGLKIGMPISHQERAEISEEVAARERALKL